MISFREKILAQVKQYNTHLCLGIDPPMDLKEGAHGVSSFFYFQQKKLGMVKWLERYCEVLLEAAHGLVPFIKPQSAYFEVAGYEGIRVLRDTMSKAKKLDYVTILDVKRGDIASTMQAYGKMAFENMEADSLTIFAYMGTDVIEPLVPWMKMGKGVYVVWVSSNPSGYDIQKHCARPLLDSLLEFSKEQFKSEVEGNLGLVYGATRLKTSAWPDEDLIHFNLLMPGIGAQGGCITEELLSFLKIHRNTIIPQSRSLGGLATIQGESEPKNWDEFGVLVRERIKKEAHHLKFADS